MKIGVTRETVDFKFGQTLPKGTLVVVEEKHPVHYVVHRPTNDVLNFLIYKKDVVLLNKEILRHIVEFIKARHVNVISESIKHQRRLKALLKDNFSMVLMAYGDPDGNHYQDYPVVIKKWEEVLASC